MALWTLDNPVITKELRGRMRGARTYWLLFGYLLLLSLILFFSYLGWWNSHSNSMDIGGSSAGFTVGRTFFKTLFYSQAVMIALITPALTAGAISIEREQRTFEMLRGTILRPRSIVWGKLASSVSFVALLLTSSLPLLSLCFLLGGVSPGEVFFAYLLLVGDAFLFGAIGLCWSAYAANTATATVLSYATLILFFVVTFPFAIPVLEDNSFTPNFGLCALNPIGAVTGAVVPEHYYHWTLPAWIPAILLNGTLSALLVLACINRLEDFPARRAAALRGVTLLFGGLIVFFGDGVLMGLPASIGLTTPVQVLLVLALACAVLLLFVPVIVTGALEHWPGNPRRIFGNATLSTGLPFALLLTAVILAVTYAAIHLGNSAPMVFPGQYNSAVISGAVPAAISLTGVQVTDVFQQGALMIVMIVAGVAGVGFLLSTLLGNRWASLTLLYLTLTLAVGLPLFAYATGSYSGPEAEAAAANAPGVNSLYLCPFIGLFQLTDRLDPHPSFPQNAYFTHMAGYGSWPIWIGTSAIYFGAGLVSYAFALTLLRRKNRRTKTA